MSELPGNWATAHLGQIAFLNPRSLDQNPAEDELVSFVPMAAVQEESGNLDPSTLKPWKDVSKGYTRFQENDVLFAKITPCMENGKYALAKGLQGGRGAGSTEFHVFRPSEALDPKFLLLFLFQSELRRAARLSMRGAAGQLRVPPEFFSSLEIHLPPRKEQSRIVAEIEKQFTRLDDAVAALKRVQANLKRYRASVLKAACEGRLVPTEAELARKEGRSYEPASELLKRILTERRAKWEADQFEKMIAAGKPPKNEEWKKRYKEPTRVQDTELPPLPEGWSWSTADQLCALITDGEHIQPPYEQSGRPMLTAMHVRDGAVEFRDYGLISQKAFDVARQRCAPSPGDVLIVSVGATTGRAAMVQRGLEPFAIVRSVLMLKTLRSVDAIYLLNWIRSPRCQEWIKRASGASAQPHFYISDTKRMAVALPPAAEAKRIAEECQRRLSLLESVERSVLTELSRASHARQSILNSAFSGKLVPQDPNDEPASVLLERIRDERGASSGGISRHKKVAKSAVRPQFCETCGAKENLVECAACGLSACKAHLYGPENNLCRNCDDVEPWGDSDTALAACLTCSARGSTVGAAQ